MQETNIKQFMQSLTLFMYNLYSFAMPPFEICQAHRGLFLYFNVNEI